MQANIEGNREKKRAITNKLMLTHLYCAETEM